MDFARVLDLIGAYLEERRVRWGVCGGLGMAAYGLARTTFDADLIVDGDVNADLVLFMERSGFQTLYRSAGFSNHLHSDPALGRVDFVFVRGETREKLFAAARPVTGPSGRTVLVPKPEHLAAMKVAAIKNDAGRTFQDLADIRYLLTLTGIDRNEVRSYFVRYGLEARFDEIAATL